jgi:hypothetical protein
MEEEASVGAFFGNEVGGKEGVESFQPLTREQAQKQRDAERPVGRVKREWGRQADFRKEVNGEEEETQAIAHHFLRCSMGVETGAPEQAMLAGGPRKPVLSQAARERLGRATSCVTIDTTAAGFLINGQAPRGAMSVDTGATPVILGLNLVRRLGLMEGLTGEKPRLGQSGGEAARSLGTTAEGRDHPVPRYGGGVHPADTVGGRASDSDTE